MCPLREIAWRERGDVGPAVDLMPDAFRPTGGLEPGRSATEALVEAGGACVAGDHPEPHALPAAGLDAGCGGAQEEGSNAAALKLTRHVEGFEQRLRIMRDKGQREARDLF